MMRHVRELALLMVTLAVTLPLAHGDSFLDEMKNALTQYDLQKIKAETFEIPGGGKRLEVAGSPTDPKINLYYDSQKKLLSVTMTGNSGTTAQNVASNPSFTSYVENKIRFWEATLGRKLLPYGVTESSNSTAVQPPATAYLRLPKLAPEVGSPYYILEQSQGAANPAEFSFFEIRPSDRNIIARSGSRLLLKFAGIKVASFGLAGFKITPESIDPGTLLLLDIRGKIWKGEPSLDEKTGRNGRGNVTALAGEFVRLESGAEDTLFAVDRGRKLFEIHPDGTMAQVGELPSEALDLHRGKNGALRVVTDKLDVLEWNATDKNFNELRKIPQNLVIDKVLAARAVDDAVWFAQKNTLTRYDFNTGHVQNTPLSNTFQNQQGGDEFQFLGIEGSKLYTRVGNHLCSFEAPVFGPNLSLRIVAESFFSEELRPFGVNYGRYSQIQALQPREADRSGARRRDLDADDPMKMKECEEALRATQPPPPRIRHFGH